MIKFKMKITESFVTLKEFQIGDSEPIKTNEVLFQKKTNYVQKHKKLPEEIKTNFMNKFIEVN